MANNLQHVFGKIGPMVETKGGNELMVRVEYTNIHQPPGNSNSNSNRKQDWRMVMLQPITSVTVSGGRSCRNCTAPVDDGMSVGLMQGQSQAALINKYKYESMATNQKLLSHMTTWKAKSGIIAQVNNLHFSTLQLFASQNLMIRQT